MQMFSEATIIAVSHQSELIDRSLMYKDNV